MLQSNTYATHKTDPLCSKVKVWVYIYIKLNMYKNANQWTLIIHFHATGTLLFFVGEYVISMRKFKFMEKKISYDIVLYMSKLRKATQIKINQSQVIRKKKKRKKRTYQEQAELFGTHLENKPTPFSLQSPWYPLGQEEEEFPWIFRHLSFFTQLLRLRLTHSSISSDIN